VTSDSGLVYLLFRDVLGREPNAATTSMLTSSLLSGEEHRGQIVVRFTESAEYVRRTGTASPIKPILPYPDVMVVSASGSSMAQVSCTRPIRSQGAEAFRLSAVIASTACRVMPGLRTMASRWSSWCDSQGASGHTGSIRSRFGRTRGLSRCPQIWDDAETVFGWSTLGTRVIVTS